MEREAARYTGRECIQSTFADDTTSGRWSTLRGSRRVTIVARADLASHPDDVRSGYHLAVRLLRERHPEGGIALLRQVIEARPDQATANFAPGKVLLEQGKVEEARRELEISVKLDPAAAYSHYKLGRAYVLAGRKQDAQREFQRTEELNAKTRKVFSPDLQQESVGIWTSRLDRHICCRTSRLFREIPVCVQAAYQLCQEAES